MMSMFTSAYYPHTPNHNRSLKKRGTARALATHTIAAAAILTASGTAMAELAKQCTDHIFSTTQHCYSLYQTEKVKNLNINLILDRQPEASTVATVEVMSIRENGSTYVHFHKQVVVGAGVGQYKPANIIMQLPTNSPQHTLRVSTSRKSPYSLVKVKSS